MKKTIIIVVIVVILFVGSVLGEILKRKIKNRKAEAHNSMGKKFFNEPDYDRAIEYYEKAIKIIPDLKEACKGIGEAYYYKGIEYYDKGKYEEAIKCYKKAIEFIYYRELRCDHFINQAQVGHRKKASLCH